MKFKIIKDGIIHCNTKEEAVELLEELKKQGHHGTDYVKENLKLGDNYIVADRTYGTGYTCTEHYGHSATMESYEFYDLILAEEEQQKITAEEAFDMLGKLIAIGPKEKMAEIFGLPSADDIFRYITGKGIVQKLVEYRGKENEKKSIETYAVDCCKIFRNEDNKQVMCWLEESDKHGDPWEWADVKYKFFCGAHNGTPEDFYYAEVSRRIYRKGGTS